MPGFGHAIQPEAQRDDQELEAGTVRYEPRAEIDQCQRYQQPDAKPEEKRPVPLHDVERYIQELPGSLRAVKDQAHAAASRINNRSDAEAGASSLARVSRLR